MTITIIRPQKKNSHILRNPKIHIIIVSLRHATPSTEAETSDSDAITTLSTKIPALCNPTLSGSVLPDASNDHGLLRLQRQQILLGLIILEYEGATTLGNVGKHPQTWLHIPQTVSS